MFADVIAKELKSLRSYAHLMSGTIDEGDMIVSEVLSGFISQSFDDYAAFVNRLQLYEALDSKFVDPQPTCLLRTVSHPVLEDLSFDERRVLLLSVIGGFGASQISLITKLSEHHVGELLDNVNLAVEYSGRTGVLIIEDEPYMAELLSLLVEQTGNWVAGVAHSLEQAVDLARRKSFGLILSDLELNQSVCGKVAVQTVHDAIGRDIPTVFITAHPDRLVEGDAPHYCGLISKPFDIWRVREAMNTALRISPGLSMV